MKAFARLPTISEYACLGLAVLLLCPALARADGGSLRISKLSGDYRITLFTAPTSLRAGAVDFSVLVQAASSEAPLLNVPVTIQVHPQGAPQQRPGGPAPAAAAPNKLFRAIQLEFSDPGPWHVVVIVHGRERVEQVETDLQVALPLPSWIDLGMWIGWPVIAIFLFGIHQYLVLRQGATLAPAPVRQPPSSLDAP